MSAKRGAVKSQKYNAFRENHHRIMNKLYRTSVTFLLKPNKLVLFIIIVLHKPTFKKACDMATKSVADTTDLAKALE